VDILTRIAADKRYEVLCKRLCSNRDEWKDLLQDTVVKLYEHRYSMIDAEREGWLYVYVIRTIYSIHLDAIKKPKLPIVLTPDYLDVKGYIVNEVGRETGKQAVNELNRRMRSKIAEESESAQVLWRACHSNIHTVSKEEGTSFYQIKKKIEPVIKQLKRKLNE